MYTVEAPRLNLKPRFINSKCMSTNFYNWTMHFRHDADILASYGFDFRHRIYIRIVRSKLQAILDFRRFDFMQFLIQCGF